MSHILDICLQSQWMWKGNVVLEERWALVSDYFRVHFGDLGQTILKRLFIMFVCQYSTPKRTAAGDLILLEFHS